MGRGQGEVGLGPRVIQIRQVDPRPARLVRVKGKVRVRVVVGVGVRVKVRVRPTLSPTLSHALRASAARCVEGSARLGGVLVPFHTPP